jgi:hypothetical protein
VPAPSVSGVSPSGGTVAGQNTVAITGSGFTGATAVAFGSVPASSFVVNSDTSITATVPAVTQAATVDVTVTTPGGTSAPGQADQYTYTMSATTTTVSLSAQPSLVGKQVTYTASVSPAPGGGSVTFTDGGILINGCNARPVTGGKATCTATPATTGAHNIVATFSGNGAAAGSTSATVTQVVTSTPCASLAGCNLQGLNLSGAQLAKANLSGANLNGAKLAGANLAGANLAGANFANANLTGASLSGATVTLANFNLVTWSGTTCPDGTTSNNDGGTCAGNL